MPDNEILSREETICGHCRFPIHPAEVGIRHFGLYTAHSEHRCRDIMRVRIAELESAIVECYDVAIPQAQPFPGGISDKATYVSKVLAEQLRGLSRLHAARKAERDSLRKERDAANEWSATCDGLRIVQSKAIISLQADIVRLTAERDASHQLLDKMAGILHNVTAIARRRGAERDAAVEASDPEALSDAKFIVEVLLEECRGASMRQEEHIAAAEQWLRGATEWRQGEIANLQTQLDAAVEAGKAAATERDRMAAHWTVRNAELSALRTKLAQYE